MAVARVQLENDCFISYEGIGARGHWLPGGGTVKATRATIEDFRDTPTASELEFVIHRNILEFDRRTREAYGGKAYDNIGYYPQLSWLALKHSGILKALSQVLDDSQSIVKKEFLGCAGLQIPPGAFMLATEMVAGDQAINWGHTTEGCGGQNLLFLYAGDIVGKVYPSLSWSRSGGLLIESFMFDGATVQA